MLPLICLASASVMAEKYTPDVERELTEQFAPEEAQPQANSIPGRARATAKAVGNCRH